MDWGRSNGPEWGNQTQKIKYFVFLLYVDVSFWELDTYFSIQIISNVR